MKIKSNREHRIKGEIFCFSNSMWQASPGWPALQDSFSLTQLSNPLKTDTEMTVLCLLDSLMSSFMNQGKISLLPSLSHTHASYLVCISKIHHVQVHNLYLHGIGRVLLVFWTCLFGGSDLALVPLWYFECHHLGPMMGRLDCVILSNSPCTGGRTPPLLHIFCFSSVS